MSTLLSDLESSPATGDGDFVQNILNEMNGGPSTGQHAPPPAISGGVINSPNPNTIAPMVMDSAPVTSHMIGNSHPTPADFANMMNTHSGPTAAPQGTDAAPYETPKPYVPPPTPKRSWFMKSLDEFRVAFFVSILFFVFSLPIINVLFAHYLPYMVKSTGDLTWLGLGVKSLLAGLAFWILQRVIVPLLSF